MAAKGTDDGSVGGRNSRKTDSHEWAALGLEFCLWGCLLSCAGQPHPQLTGSAFGTRTEARLLETFSGRLGGEGHTVCQP